MKPNGTAPVLRVSGATGGYGDIVVVRDVSFEVHAGSITALLGRNGSGKTTTMRLVSGLNPLVAGDVELDGESIGSMPAHVRVGKGLAYVQEGKRIFRKRSVRENVVLGAYTAKLSRREGAERVDEAFDRFPALAAKAAMPAGSLSGGQQQMLAVAQALAPRPRVLMLDEPTTGLAPAIVGELFELVAGLRAEGLAVVLVEQSLELTLGVADTAVVINLGSVVFEGDASHERTRLAAEEIYLGAGAAL